MTNPEPPVVTVPVSLRLRRCESTGEIMTYTDDVLRTLDDLAMVYDVHGWPALAASLRSFRNNLTDEVRAAAPKEAP